MNRRQLLQLTALAALAPAGICHAAPRKSKANKKGLGIGPKSPDFSRKLEELRCQWFYSWISNIPANVPKGIAYTPMIWDYRGGREGVINAGKAAKEAGIPELLGFNEPDQSSQANMTVEAALDAWPSLQETGLRLGSPGCVHPDREWMEAFMAGAKKRELRVDFICIHSYGSPNAEAFIKRLEAVYKLYRKPIWITEFAVGDWKAKSPAENQYKPKDVLRFMEDVLPELDKLDFIERYAWFPAGPANRALGTSALHDAEGKLTRLGECYRDA